MDFLSDALFDCRKFRALIVVDNRIRECLAIEVAQPLTADDMVRVLTNAAQKAINIRFVPRPTMGRNSFLWHSINGRMRRA
jgi:hypothetical protein